MYNRTFKLTILIVTKYFLKPLPNCYSNFGGFCTNCIFPDLDFSGSILAMLMMFILLDFNMNGEGKHDTIVILMDKRMYMY